jgi:outer membrane murein-binding lipoprotein Lpp
MRRRAATVSAAVVALATGLVTGCSSGQPGDLTVSAERQLVAKVQQVRDVAATGSYAELARDVRQLNSLVERLHSQGQVSDARFSAIEDAAGKLLSDAQPKASPTPSASSSSPSPSSSATSASPSASASQSQSQPPSQSPTPTTTISIP